jgi:hypothetical protein
VAIAKLIKIFLTKQRAKNMNGHFFNEYSKF